MEQTRQGTGKEVTVEHLEKFARIKSCLRDPLAERMSFSSFGHSVDDVWGHDIKRPYWIVLMPGYRIPADLDLSDKDAMWYPRERGPLNRSIIVWDGFCPTALHEIVRECFDYSGSSSFIKVVDAETGKIVKDYRDREIMAMRPARDFGLGPKGLFNHLVELHTWSQMFPDSRTRRIFAETINPFGDESTETIDSYKRSEFFMNHRVKDVGVYEMEEELMAKVARRELVLHDPPAKGPPFNADLDKLKRDKKIARFDTTLSATLHHAPIHKNDFRDTGPPESFFEFADRKGLAVIEARKNEDSGSLGEAGGAAGKGESVRGDYSDHDDRHHEDLGKNPF